MKTTAIDMASLVELRAEIATTTAKLNELKSRPEPIHTALSRIRSQVEAARERFESIQDNTATLIACSVGPGPSIDQFHDHLFAWLAYTSGDDLIADLEQRATEKRQAKGMVETISGPDRTQQLESLSRQLYDLEIREEAMVSELRAPRRSGVTTAAVLGIPFDVAKLAGVLN